MTKILTRKPMIRYRAVWEDQEFFVNSREPMQFAVVRHSRPHLWNNLGSPGQTEFSGTWNCSFYKLASGASKKVTECLDTVWDKSKISNKIGNNDHLHGMCYYDVVEVVPVQAVGQVSK